MMRGLMSLSLLFALGCGTARDVGTYRSDTQKLLETRRADLGRCYDEALRADAKLGGAVAVRFLVERKSGVIKEAAIDSSRSTAPTALGACVLKAVEGLRIDPGDRNDGRATFVYEFKPGAP
jgi:hypothetical protein